MTIALALAVFLGLALLLPHINYALFKDYTGNAALVLFVFPIVFTAVIQAYQSTAQSKNSFRPFLRRAGQGLLVKGSTTPFLTGLLGTAGASLSILLGLGMILQCFVRVETEELNTFWKERHFRRKLIISFLYTTAALLLYYSVLNIVFDPVAHRSAVSLVSVIDIGIGTFVFIYTVIRLRLFTIREWLMLPLGKRILRLNKKIKK